MTIYFWADRSVDDMLNETFEIKQNGNGDLRLSTPETFSFDDFFDFAFNIDLTQHIQEEFHNTREFRSLTKILNAIKESR